MGRKVAGRLQEWRWREDRVTDMFQECKRSLLARPLLFVPPAPAGRNGGTVGDVPWLRAVRCRTRRIFGGAGPQREGLGEGLGGLALESGGAGKAAAG